MSDAAQPDTENSPRSGADADAPAPGGPGGPGGGAASEEKSGSMHDADVANGENPSD